MTSCSSPGSTSSAASKQRPLDLVSLPAKAAADFETVANDHVLSWQPDGEIMVRGDRIRLRQVIDNLLNNARMHTPAGSRIDMSVPRNGSSAELVIADNGPGIPVEDQKRVFERFWRADRSRTRNTGGTGLGLAIVQSLVQAHGGTVRLESQPGQGRHLHHPSPPPQPTAVASTPRHSVVARLRTRHVAPTAWFEVSTRAGRCYPGVNNPG